MKEKLPATDSRLRPDQRHLENGEFDKANEEKLRLETRQRMVYELLFFINDLISFVGQEGCYLGEGCDRGSRETIAVIVCFSTALVQWLEYGQRVQ